MLDYFPARMPEACGQRIKHAKHVMEELTSLSPVGDWTFLAGIRHAKKISCQSC